LSAVVAVIGEGHLADFVCTELCADYRLVRQRDLLTDPPEAVDLALVADDAWNPTSRVRAQELFQRAGIPWLGGFAFFGEGVIGPLVIPGTPGCSQCADLRRLLAGNDRKETWGLQQTIASQGGLARNSWASRTALLQMAQLLASEVRRVLQGDKGHLVERVVLVNLKTLKSSCHLFLPDPLCPMCRQLPDDSSAEAQITLQPSLKINAESYRCRPMSELKRVLVKDYLDYRMGLLNGKMHDLVSTFADVSVNLPMPSGDEVCAGRTHSYTDSELTAVLEGLERHCGLSPRGKKTTVHDSYRNVKEYALDPLKVGLHAQEQYERPDFPFQPFDPDRSTDWVWGYSFLQERPILVPQLLAYYSTGCGRGFVYETSNGCALGGSLEEAIFYGILEVIERDSFLMTWYAQLPLPRLDPYSADDRELRLMLDRLHAVAGYEVLLFNSTMEHGIPSVWAIAKNVKPQGVNLICAAGAHPDPIRAVKGAIHELSAMLLTLDEKFESNRENYMLMLDDSSLVRHMEDHSMLYSLPEAEERLRFLVDERRPLRTFDEEFKRPVRHLDLTDDLKDFLRVFRRLGLDVVVVNQTTPETLRNGLHCVKVLIPGMLPMTFGQHLTRLTGLDRVLKVPYELGYVKQPLAPEQLNSHPHPFP
jgi:ribosomal protein S12 methylthiotransferase accessory factor